MTRVKSVSSPLLLLAFLAISMALAVPIIPLAEVTIVTGAGFVVYNTDEVRLFFLCERAVAWRGMECYLKPLVGRSTSVGRRRSGGDVHSQARRFLGFV